MKAKILAMIAATFFALGVAGQLTRLDDIISTIAQKHPSVKMFDAEVRADDEAAKGAWSWEAPEISTGLWMTPYNVGLWKKNADGTPGMGQYMVGVEQMIPNKKAQQAKAAYLEAISSVNKENKNARLNELYAEAKRNYAEWQVTRKKLSILRQDKQLLQFMMQSAELRYKTGLGRINAYYKAKAALGSIENSELVLNNDILAKKTALNTLMNRDDTTDFDIDTAYIINDYSNYIFDSSTLNNRGDIKAVDQSIRITSLQQAAERMKLKPQFGIAYDHMFGFGGLPMQYSLMATVKLPIAKWASGESKANIESLGWKQVALDQQKKEMINALSGSARQLRNDIVLKKKQLKLYETNIIPALQNNYKFMQLGYEQNTEELFQLYDAWESLNMTQLDYLDQLQQLLLLQVDLEKILEIK
jgi:outer membrane protein, heavy metal efflux system